GTEVVVTFDQERTVSLKRGQAFFEVMKGDKRPFVVHAGDRRVVAKGTSFDVRLDSGAVEVTLVEGRVTVDQPALPGARRATAGQPSELQPGEKLVAKIGGSASIAPANVESTTGWISGKHVFQDVKLGDALTEINRYTDKPIVIMDPRIADIHISG